MIFGFRIAVIVSLIFVIIGSCSQAQNLFIYDKQTNLPIKGVIVSTDNKKQTATTDDLGIVDISIFKDEEYVNLQHALYESRRISLFDISRSLYRTGLEKKQDKTKDGFFDNNGPDNYKNSNIIELINDDDIRLFVPSKVVDLLDISTQVYIRKNQLGDGDPMIRGFSNNRLLYYLDGVKMNNAIFGNDQVSHLFMVDTYLVNRSEILFGPGSGNYGNGAFGGVINFHLTEPQLSKSENWMTTGNGIAKISSAEFEKTLHADINLSNNKWAFLASISYSDFDDLKMGKHNNDYTQRTEFISEIMGMDSIVENNDPNVQKFSAFNTFSFVSKVKQQFTSNVDWTLSYYLTRTNSVPRYDRLLEYSGDELKYAENYINPQQWMMNSLEINFKEPAKLYDHIKFIAAYQNYKQGINEREYKNRWLNKRSENVNILSASLDFNKTLRRNNTLHYGVDFTYNTLESKGEKVNHDNSETEWLDSRYADGSNKTIESGIYGNYLKVCENFPVTISSGMRFSYVGLKSVYIDTNLYTESSHTINLRNMALKANVGIAYHPNNWLINLNLSSGFKAPDFDDVTRIYSPGPKKVVVPNENLKPEYLYNADLGIQYNFSNLFVVDFDIFFSYLYNAMIILDFKLDGRDSTMYNGEISKIQSMVNSGNAIVYGTTLNLNWQIFKQLKFKQSLTLIESLDNHDLTLKDTPPLYGRSALSFEENNFILLLSVSYNSKLGYDRLPQYERDRAYLYATDSNGNPYAPSWWIIDLYANYNFAENIQVSAGVNNILDYRYRPYSWGITAPGRNFKLSFRYGF